MDTERFLSMKTAREDLDALVTMSGYSKEEIFADGFATVGDFQNAKGFPDHHPVNYTWGAIHNCRTAIRVARRTIAARPEYRPMRKLERAVIDLADPFAPATKRGIKVVAHGEPGLYDDGLRLKFSWVSRVYRQGIPQVEKLFIVDAERLADRDGLQVYKVKYATAYATGSAIVTRASWADSNMLHREMNPTDRIPELTKRHLGRLTRLTLNQLAS